MNEIEPKAFFNACTVGDSKTVQEFINQREYPIDIRNNMGWTGLIMACFNEKAEIAKLLIRNGADVNATNQKGTTVFMYAKTPIQKKPKSTRFLEYLLNKGANINALDNKGMSVLDYVVENKCFVLAEWLVKMGAKRGQGDFN